MTLLPVVRDDVPTMKPILIAFVDQTNLVVPIELRRIYYRVAVVVRRVFVDQSMLRQPNIRGPRRPIVTRGVPPWHVQTTNIDLDRIFVFEPLLQMLFETIRESLLRGFANIEKRTGATEDVF